MSFVSVVESGFYTSRKGKRQPIIVDNVFEKLHQNDKFWIQEGTAFLVSPYSAIHKAAGRWMARYSGDLEAVSLSPLTLRIAL